ncbi:MULTISPECIES: hypothetical protein [unclassified Rhizobacter]|uniref:hypothetical protein n=1 Tax=unclassified Rhizobacter TaxID=2640088 RepID=UPI0012F9D48F|nr:MULTISPECIES: hypothetical protein [unclassified Rhizobacter]
MTSSLNGTGTHLYGDRERDIGGTYITTKWIVILGAVRISVCEAVELNWLLADSLIDCRAPAV